MIQALRSFFVYSVDPSMVKPLNSCSWAAALRLYPQNLVCALKRSRSLSLRYLISTL